MFVICSSQRTISANPEPAIGHDNSHALLQLTNINFLQTTLTNTSSKEKVMAINKMITKGKCFDLLSSSLNELFKEMYVDQSGESVCGYWGVTRDWS